ncbi:M23 family metallopeptidase [Candidatus Uhrbacteria bacterium]|nr:M23 family metallopeptidase [Candidatus Uhrbacteria bacterium]
MTKFRIKIAFLRLGISWYRFLSQVLHSLRRLLLGLARGLGNIGRRGIFPPVLWVYRLIFYVRRQLTLLFRPFQTTVLYFFSHRNILHLAIASLVAGTGLISLGSRAAAAEDLGTRSILYSLVAVAGDELIEEGAVPSLESFPTEYLVDMVAVGKTPAVDFDFINESYVSAVTGATAIEPAELAGRRATTARTSLTTYEVKEGDTVSSIAESFGLAIDTVLWANKLTVRSYIRPGDQLTILPLDGVLHTVKKGETLEKITKQYNAESREVLAWNTVESPDSLRVGTQLLVPGGRITPPPAPRRISPPTTLFTGPKPPGAPSVGGTKLLWPVAATRISQYFGWRHTGVDIAGPSGTAIYAADDGIVEHAGWSGGYGLNVVINHGNGLKTRYAHASKIYVKKGDTVSRGETIEAVGSTGRSTGPHVHFEVIRNGKFLNPLEFIR